MGRGKRKIISSTTNGKGLTQLRMNVARPKITMPEWTKMQESWSLEAGPDAGAAQVLDALGVLALLQEDREKVIEEHERNRRIKLERIEAFEEAKRFGVFVVDRVPLVFQQAAALRRETGAHVCELCGEPLCQ